MKVYYSDEEIVCKASGNPQPRYRWVNMNGRSDNIPGDVINLNLTMVGLNRWRCVATSVINGSENSTALDHEFTVSE